MHAGASSETGHFREPLVQSRLYSSSVGRSAEYQGRTGAQEFFGIPPPMWRQAMSAWSIEATMRNANAATVIAVEACRAGDGQLLRAGTVRAMLRLSRCSMPPELSPNHLLTCAAPKGCLRADHSAPAPERTYDNTNADRCLAVRRDAGCRTSRK